MFTIACAAPLTEVLSVPPMLDEEVVGFRVVPTWDRSAVEDASTAVPAPALLMLTQTRDDFGNTARSLKILRCPVNPVSMWALEVGCLAEPRLAVEVLPGLTPVTVRRPPGALALL